MATKYPEAPTPPVVVNPDWTPENDEEIQ